MTRFAVLAGACAVVLLAVAPVRPDGMPEETTASVRDPRVLPDGRYDRRAYGPPYGDAEYRGVPHQPEDASATPCPRRTCAR